jgi:hypothetical protein
VVKYSGPLTNIKWGFHCINSAHIVTQEVFLALASTPDLSYLLGGGFYDIVSISNYTVSNGRRLMDEFEGNGLTEPLRIICSEDWPRSEPSTSQTNQLQESRQLTQYSHWVNHGSISSKGNRFSLHHCVRTSSEGCTPSYSMGVEGPGHNVHHAPPHTAEVKDAWN